MGVRVETREGILEGVEERGIHVFRGIPFARPPLGPLRFRPPQPPDPWIGVRDASRFSASAPQDEPRLNFAALGVGPQSEDCLYLNIYTPCADGGRRPVMVWIHGGAFMGGSASQAMYQGHGLVGRGDVVMVAANYRLGALGFLHLAELCGKAFTGAANLGLLDQIATLAWVRENIASFGGDPENVTIFGESAGAMSVGTLLGTPAARGLFRRAIAQSGATEHVHGGEQATGVARTFLEEVGVAPGEAHKLHELPLETIRRAQRHCVAHHTGASTAIAFQPAVDGSVLPRHPLAAVQSGCAREVALLIGTTRDEWTFWAISEPRLGDLDETGLLKRVMRRLPDAIPEARRMHVARELMAGYRAARDGRFGTSPRDLFTAFQSDRNFHLPARQLAEAQHAHNTSIWTYLMTWESPAADGALGACHGIDVPFVFGMIGRKGVELFAGEGPEAEALQDRIMGAWLAFARTGEPSHPGLPPWARFDPVRRTTMLLGRECVPLEAPFDAEHRTWKQLLGS